MSSSPTHAVVKMTVKAQAALPIDQIHACVRRAVDTGSTETVRYRGEIFERAVCQGRGNLRSTKLWILMELQPDGDVIAYVGLPSEFKGTRKI